MNRYGIVQGRLSEPLNGFQETPIEWEREFILIEELGISYIEWIVTKKGFDNNPLFGKTVKPYADKVSSVCCDNLIDGKITEESFLNENLLPICNACSENGIKNITIPLLEDSDISSVDRMTSFLPIINRFSEMFPIITFNFEMECHWSISSRLLESNPGFVFTYDTGNMNSMGHNHIEYIGKIHDKIKTVHLKDRNMERKTLEPGLGGTDFNTIFQSFKKLQMSPIFILQTARGENGKEFETIKRHLKYFKEQNEQ